MINLNATIKTKDHDGFKLQTVNEKMWMLTKWQGDVVHCMTPDGPSDDFCWHIVLTNFFTGEEYVLKTTIHGRIEGHNDPECDELYYMNGRNRADRLIEQMYKVGQIDLNNWRRTK